MHLLRIYHILGTKDVWVNAGPSYSQGAVSVFGEKDLCSKGYSAKCSDQYWSSAPGCSGIMEESPNSPRIRQRERAGEVGAMHEITSTDEKWGQAGVPEAGRA